MFSTTGYFSHLQISNQAFADPTESMHVQVGLGIPSLPTERAAPFEGCLATIPPSWFPRHECIKIGTLAPNRNNISQIPLCSIQEVQLARINNKELQSRVKALCSRLQHYQLFKIGLLDLKTRGHPYHQCYSPTG